MLVLARSAGQSVVLDERITITVIETSGGIVRLGISAPVDVGVRRGELDRHTDAQRRARAAHPAGSGAAATIAASRSAGAMPAVDVRWTRSVEVAAAPAVEPARGPGSEPPRGVVDVTESRRNRSPSAGQATEFVRFGHDRDEIGTYPSIWPPSPRYPAATPTGTADEPWP